MDDGCEHILYTSREPAAKREGEERHNKSFEVGDHSYLTQAASRSAHLWRVAVEGGVAEKLTEGVENIGSFVVSPDGATVALEVWPSPHTADEYNNGIRSSTSSRVRRVNCWRVSMSS